MTKMEANELNNAMAQVMDKFCAEHNLERSKLFLTWNDVTFSWKIEAKALDENGFKKADPREERDAQWFLVRKGIKTTDEPIIGRFVNVSDLGRCKITGFNSRSPKYAFTVTTDTGKTYRTTAASIDWAKAE